MDQTRRSLGEILVGFGRISESDVDAALDYQKEHGGYFGEALLALDRVSPEELEWSLASQFDLPYVFPDADAIDPDAAALVSPHWALRHLALPIMKTEHTITMVVDSPARGDAVRELQASTGLEIELALAPAGRIRELIRRLYGEGNAVDEPGGDVQPVPLTEFLSIAFDGGATGLGVSVRGGRAVGWYRGEGHAGKCILDGRWRGDLENHLAPAPSASTRGRDRARWRGHLQWGDRRHPVEVRFVGGESGAELAFQPTAPRPSAERLLSAPPVAIQTEIGLLARAGAARFRVVADPSLAVALLPQLPALTLGPLTRSLHLGAASTDVERSLVVELPHDAEAREALLEDLESFRFEAMTVAVDSPDGNWLARASRLAPSVFVAAADGGAISMETASEVGLGWELSIRVREGSAPTEWAVHPLDSRQG